MSESNSIYVIKYLKANYPSFRRHVESLLDEQAKKMFWEPYQRAFDHHGEQVVRDALRMACDNYKGNQFPTLSDIKQNLSMKASVRILTSKPAELVAAEEAHGNALISFSMERDHEKKWAHWDDAKMHRDRCAALELSWRRGI